MTKSFPKIAFTIRHALIASILICVLGCVTSLRDYNRQYPSQQSAIRRLSIEIDRAQYEELFSRTREFSERHRLKYYLSFYNEKETFYILMEGKGVSINALSFANTTELVFDFFETDPTKPPPQEIVDELISDLKISVSDIPNITIVEEK